MDKNGLTYTTKSCKTIFLYNSFKKKKKEISFVLFGNYV